MRRLPSRLLVSAAVCSACVLPAPATGQFPTTDRFAAEWVGVFHRYPHILEVQVRIDRPLGETEGMSRPDPAATAGGAAPPTPPASRRAASRRGDMSAPVREAAAAPGGLPAESRSPNAVVRILPVAEVQGIGRGLMGEYPARVSYDERTGAVRIVPDASAYGVLGFRPPALRGVLDPTSGRIGGVVVDGPDSSSPYFVLAPPDRYASELRDTMRETMERWNDRIPRGRLSGVFGGGAPEVKELLEWARRLVDEYPDPNTVSNVHGQIELVTRNLLADANFEPVFGKRFEELSLRDKGAIARRIQGIPRPRANFAEDRPNEVVHMVARPLTALGGTYAIQDMVVSVFGMRAIHGWREAVVAGLREWGPAPETIERLHAIDTVGEAVLAWSWPSDREGFSGALRQSRALLAEPALIAAVDEAIGSAGGVAGARHLLGAAAPEGSLGTLFAEVDPAVAGDQRRRLEAGADVLLVDATAAEEAGLAALGTGMSGLEAGVGWYADLQRRYLGLQERAPVRALHARLAEVRSAAFPDAAEGLRQQVTAAASAQDVADVVARYLSVPSDAADAVAGPIVRLAAERSRALASDEASVRAAMAEEQRIANHFCTRSTSASSPAAGLPSPREACFAVAALLKGRQESLSDTTGCEHPRDPLTALRCLTALSAQTGWGAPELTIDHFGDIRCVPRDDGGSVLCEFVLGLRSGNPYVGPVLNAMPPEVTTMEFVRRGGDWRALPRN